MNLQEINSFEDICKIGGHDPIAILPFAKPVNQFQTAVNSFAMITIIADVLNEGWKPDWNNYGEYKYYPWFDMETYGDQVGSGVGFSSYGFNFVHSYSSVGSRLVFKTSELAEFAGTKFLDIYKGFMVIEK